MCELHPVRAVFLASDQTYGARRVWHDLLADVVRAGCTGSND
jgi:putative transposase